jgi:osmotically-inducible protein OsmY
MNRDARIENDVRDALRRDSRIKRPDLIAVSADEIGTVVLHGAVESLRQRAAAAREARQVDGVSEVIVDDLRVHPPVARLLDDDAIRAAAQQQIIWDSRIRSEYIDVKVSRGWVTLSGYVRHESESVAAVDDVMSLTGVAGVTDHIEVR